MTIEQIKATKHFKSIKDKTIQSIVISLDSRKKIIYGCNITKSQSFELWVNISKPPPHIKQIVRELMINEIQVNQN